MNLEYCENKEWRQLLSEILQDNMTSVEQINKHLSRNNFYPVSHQIFRAFDFHSPSSIKVVLLGQDPYIQPKQATGLSFSVPEGVAIPPSLRNIFKELSDDTGIKTPKSGDLTKWAKDERILLLNSALTVEKGNSGSHLEAWEPITDEIIRKLSVENPSAVFILLGNYAKKKSVLIENKSRIVHASHPSPYSANKGFFGSKIFSRTNSLLTEPVDWNL